jgi:hypothetical protein
MSFKIGDRVEVIHNPDVAYTHGAHLFIGKSGVIVSDLEYASPMEWDDPVYYKSHRVQFESGRVRHFIPQCLRRIDANPDWITLCHLTETPVDFTVEFS